LQKHTARCSSAVKNVHQTPRDLVWNKQESANVYCSHSISTESHLLGYLNMMFKNPEEAIRNKMTLSGDGRNSSTLTIKNLQPNDSAVYFCAVRYTVLQTAVLFNKNLVLLYQNESLPL
uniref:Ig-like domain-containing protein n=1 Tax=Pygocentrus nattereri TaxID=42514 RepID=A0AAR2KRA6_PYGNA